MPNAIHKLSRELAAKIAERAADITIKDLIEKTERSKAAGEDTGRFHIIISDESVDRHGEVILQDGMDTGNYMKNPVVLFGHDYWSLPVGVTESITKEIINGIRVTIAEGRFAPADANPEAQKIRRLYEEKILTTSSVGIIANEMQGNTITKSELLEWSFVPVPANPNALSLAKEIGLDAALISKIFRDTKHKDTENTDPEARAQETPEKNTPEAPQETPEMTPGEGEEPETTETTPEGETEQPEGTGEATEGMEKAAVKRKIDPEQVGAIMNKLQNAIIQATAQATQDLITLASVEGAKGAAKSTEPTENTNPPAQAGGEASPEGAEPGQTPEGEGTGEPAEGSAEELVKATEVRAKAQQVLKQIATATGEILAELNALEGKVRK